MRGGQWRHHREAAHKEQREAQTDNNNTHKHAQTLQKRGNKGNQGKWSALKWRVTHDLWLVFVRLLFYIYTRGP
jgi:hypothetical protein